MPLAIAVVASAQTWGGGPPASSEPGPITYSSVDEALRDLHAKSTVTFRSQGGWIVAQDSATATAWLITPLGHPAYPSIVRRMIVNGPTGANMTTTVMCFSSQETCDKFFGSK